MPDDEEMDTSTEAHQTKADANKSPISESPMRASPTSTMPLSPSASSNASSHASTLHSVATPQSSLDPDAEEVPYYNFFTRFDIASSNADYKSEYNKVQTHGGGVDPALLAAVSIAKANERVNLTTLHTHLPTGPATDASSATNALLAAVSKQDSSMDPSFIFEPLSVMHQQGYFSAPPRVSEFK